MYEDLKKASGGSRSHIALKALFHKETRFSTQECAPSYAPKLVLLIVADMN